MPSPGFSENAWTTGTLYGLRAFDVDFTGHLKSIYRKYRWVEGENLAACKPMSMFIGKTTRWAEGEVGHEGWANCGCGFYGFTNGENTYLADGSELSWPFDRRVAGVIEAWGRVVVGTKGFRAEKVALRALILPPGEFAGVPANYPSVAIFPTTEAALAEFPLTPYEEMAA